MSAEQCVIPAMRGVHLKWIGPGRWRLSGEANTVEVKREDNGWTVECGGIRLGSYRVSADGALAHAYSIASDPVKRVS